MRPRLDARGPMSAAARAVHAWARRSKPVSDVYHFCGPVSTGARLPGRCPSLGTQPEVAIALPSLPTLDAHGPRAILRPTRDTLIPTLTPTEARMDVPLLFGPYGSSSLEHADLLSDYDANAVWFHGFDAEAFEACAQNGLFACVEFKTFRADFDAHPELIPIGADGQPIRYGRLVQGVCLSQESFLEKTRSELRAGLREYHPVGIWLDYLTYAGWFETPNPDLQESCFCSACIAEFCDSTGIDATTPAHILATAPGVWTQHKCERIARYATEFSQIIRSAQPSCVIGAYMCPWTPAEFDGALRRIFAQDYDLLARAIDVFTPLIYAEKSGRPAGWGREFLEQAAAFVPAGRKVQLIPGLPWTSPTACGRRLHPPIQAGESRYSEVRRYSQIPSRLSCFVRQSNRFAGAQGEREPVPPDAKSTEGSGILRGSRGQRVARCGCAKAITLWERNAHARPGGSTEKWAVRDSNL